MVLGCGGARSAPPVRRAEGRYPVPAEVGRLVADARAFAELARAVRQDLARDGADAVAAVKDRLFVIALFDALDGHWEEALAGIDRIAAMETDPVQRAMTGLTIRVWVDARAHGGDTPEAFRGALERRLATMSIPAVRKELSMLRTMAQVFTADLCRQLVAAEVGSRVVDGSIGLAEVHVIAFQRYAVERLVPVGTVIDEVLAAAGIEPLKQ